MATWAEYISVRLPVEVDHELSRVHGDVAKNPVVSRTPTTFANAIADAVDKLTVRR